MYRQTGKKKKQITIADSNEIKATAEVQKADYRADLHNFCDQFKFFLHKLKVNRHSGDLLGNYFTWYWTVIYNRHF